MNTALVVMASMMLSQGQHAEVAMTDLASLREQPIKEPKYESATQKYCLLVFGINADKLVWVVRDWTTLYVDLKGDGDLRDPGDAFPGNGAWYTVQHVAIEGTRVDSIIVNLNSDHDLVSTRDEAGKGIRLAAKDPRGGLKFSSRRSDAPVIWFDGPLEMSLCVAQTMHRNDERPWLSVKIGTPGLGAGTFSAINERLVPADVHPLVEVVQRMGGGHRELKRVRLLERC